MQKYAGLTEDHFNSIKVQLERQQQKRRGLLLVFQFHKGTIRTAARSALTS